MRSGGRAKKEGEDRPRGREEGDVDCNMGGDETAVFVVVVIVGCPVGEKETGAGADGGGRGHR